METNRNVLATVGIIGLIVGLAGGYFIGAARGGAAVEQRLAPFLELAFPKPSLNIQSLGGTVTNAYGASFTLEIDNIDDYLPHLDGSPRTKESRTVNVTANTMFTLIDYSSLDARGNPSRTPQTFSSLKVGDTVMVRSDENVRNVGTFDAREVEWVRY
ncbi:MAG: hypothetical protein V1885_00700 [Candidatus Brennerbacteria bacterium]